MKHLNILMSCIAAVLMLSACSKHEDYLSLSGSYFDSDHEDEYINVYVSSNVNWTVTSNSSWCMVEGDAYGNGDGSFVLYLYENTSTEARRAIVTVQGGGITQQVLVSQDGAPLPPKIDYTINDPHDVVTNQPASVKKR